MKRLFALILLVVTSLSGWAQCAMCRTQLENNLSNGDPGMASSLNIAILYLLVMPYLAVFVIGYFWYKSSRNAYQNPQRGSITG